MTDNIAFRYISIPADYGPSTRQRFDKMEMNREHDYGGSMALKDITWITAPPGYAAPDYGLMTK